MNRAPPMAARLKIKVNQGQIMNRARPMAARLINHGQIMKRARPMAARLKINLGQNMNRVHPMTARLINHGQIMNRARPMAAKTSDFYKLLNAKTHIQLNIQVLEDGKRIYLCIWMKSPGEKHLSPSKIYAKKPS